MNVFKYSRRSFLREIAVSVCALLFVSPLYLLISISLKSDKALQTSPVSFPVSSPNWHNYAEVWSNGGATDGMGRALLNTVIITVFSVLLLIIIAAPTGYVIARHSSRFSRGVYILFVLGLIVPITLGLLPLYVVMRDLGLVGNYAGIIVLHAAISVPFAVFLYSGFIRALPNDFEESAEVDGARQWRTFTKVVLPLLRPITVTIVVLNGLFVWNDFFLSLIFLTGTDIGPIPVTLNSFVQAQSFTQWNLIFSGVVIAIGPVLLMFIVAQRQFVRGLAGGIRG